MSNVYELRPSTKTPEPESIYQFHIPERTRHMMIQIVAMHFAQELKAKPAVTMDTITEASWGDQHVLSRIDGMSGVCGIFIPVDAFRAHEYISELSAYLEGNPE